jgi:chromate transporter
MTEPTAVPAEPRLAEIASAFFVIGCLGFGGPAGQIALMHRELVDRRGWIDEARFLHALNFAMLLPGPEAQQLATHVGRLVGGTRGGLVAGTLFVLPGLVVMIGLCLLHATHRDAPWLAGIFFAFKAAVVAIVAEAVVRMARRTLKTGRAAAIAVAAFFALFVFAVPFPLVVAAAAIVGWCSGGGTTSPAPVSGGRRLDGGMLVPAVVGLSLWAAPVAAVAIAFGPDDRFVGLAVHLSQMAVAGFGGAYAVLAWVAQTVVEGRGWLTPAEMLDGLALAETTPGPLVLVLTWVGFMTGLRAPSGLSPILGGLLGAGLATWVTFVPSMLFVFLAGPHVEALRAKAALSRALAAIGAAVTGVIGNLALWFALHVLFAKTVPLAVGPIALSLPDPGSLDPLAAAIAVGAAVALFGFRLGVVATLGLAAVAGLAIGRFG